MFAAAVISTKQAQFAVIAIKHKSHDWKKKHRLITFKQYLERKEGDGVYFNNTITFIH